MPIIAQRWGKAVTVSLLFHVFALTAVGYSALRLFSAPPVVQQYIELDLANALPATSSASSTFESPAAPSPAPEPSQLAPVMEQALPAPLVTSADTIAPSMVVAEVSAADSTGEGVAVQAVTGNGGATSGKGRSERGGIIPPRILSKAEPDYPAAARQAEMQGTVLLKVQILENGRSGAISIIRSSGYELLDNAAVAAVQRWRFVPAKDPENGRAAICYSTLPVSFRLR